MSLVDIGHTLTGCSRFNTSKKVMCVIFQILLIMRTQQVYSAEQTNVIIFAILFADTSSSEITHFIGKLCVQNTNIIRVNMRLV